MIRLNSTISIFAMFVLVSCATGGKKKKVGGSKAVSKASENFDDAEEERESGSTLVSSLSNNPMTSKVVSGGNAEKALSRISGSMKGTDAQKKVKLKSKIAAQRLSRKSLSQVLSSARSLADIEMKSGLKKGLPSSVKLEIGIAAMMNKNFAMADFMLLPLKSSKNRKIAAGAYNALGVLALKEGRIPEAVKFFESALSKSSNYEAAMLNLGFVALNGGDLDTAKKMLNRVKPDWYTESGLLILARRQGNSSAAEAKCKKIMGKRKHKPTYFNCGLNAWFGEKNAKKARNLINSALKMRGGNTNWDQKGYKILEKIPQK